MRTTKLTSPCQYREFEGLLVDQYGTEEPLRDISNDENLS